MRLLEQKLDALRKLNAEKKQKKETQKKDQALKVELEPIKK